MISWFSNSYHLIFILLICFLIIITQEIFIFHILREKNKKNYGESNVAQRVGRFRDFWGEFVIYVLATSIVGLFIAGLIKEDSITLADMNSWVSIVLGLVALVVGIISLWLSFYNVDQMTKSQEVIEKKVKEINAKKGWQEAEKGEWYFIDINGEKVRNKWKKSGDYWYYLGEDGYILTNEIVKEKGDIYYVDIDGHMVINKFEEFEEGERYFGPNGKAVMNGEHIIDGKAHIFKNGYIVREAG